MTRRLPKLLTRDVGVTRYLPWIVAVLMFLASLAASGGLLVYRAIDAWSGDLQSTLTVEVGGPRDSQAERADTLVAALREAAHVQSARIVPEDEVARLLKPWLGEEAALAELPLPVLIDVKLLEPDSTAVVRVHDLVARTDAESAVDDHGIWLAQLRRLSRAVQVVCVGIVLLVGLATGLAIVFGTRAAMTAHRDIIELFHIMGAQDGVIAGRFQIQAVGMALRGGFVGLALAILTLFALSHAVGPGLGLMSGVALVSAGDLLLVSTLPLLAGLLAAVTARRTVARNLESLY